MLESNNLLANLVQIASKTEDLMKQNLVLDILIWIVSIRMARFRCPKIEFRKNNKKGNDYLKTKPNENLDYNMQQVDCIKVIEENLSNLILSCIVHGNRTTAHKCVKIIMMTAE